MPVNTEKEFKCLINADQAGAITTAYAFNAPYTQTNTYFDTAKRALAASRCALRIRQFADHGEQTIKVLANAVPRKILEYTDPLTTMQASELADAGKILAPGTVASQLHVLGIDLDAVKPFARATTTRSEYPFAAGLLVVDHTQYPDGYCDWELEMEYSDFEPANAFFTNLEEQFHIQPSKVTSKIVRATAHS
ncbi:CYTH domain-containing protein [Lacticaseibacillus sharpeae]|uniref:CYTH domain-containing protein n=1 Tax=Lacticaseibacillus sharpeae JCM 1186 = DSM 20505 TaxID=1291052 RepID=A0A0R1ZLV1_9LACO|nr:CYTH domain-containing protein [Lacticaseibacillus sharpeae]KRM55519.1 hypothetical protein FC18_GL001237 [Lacticaseibacillus sharpeae JCM 1186 = DSM 20505]